MLDIFQGGGTANLTRGAPSGSAAKCDMRLRPEARHRERPLRSRRRQLAVVTIIPYGMTQRKLQNTIGEETWTQKLTTTRASAPSPAAPADTATATGGRSTSISACSIPTRPLPIRW